MKNNKNYIRIALITLSILVIPFVAMWFTEEVKWTLSDFVIMGVLISGTGLLYEFASKRGGNLLYRVALGIALGASFIIVWMNGAVGIIGNENNPANLMYFGVLLILFVGALISKLKSEKMSYVLFVTASAQFLVPVLALIIWKPNFTPGLLGVFVLNSLFVILFILSGLLFKKASIDSKIK